MKDDLTNGNAAVLEELMRLEVELHSQDTRRDRNRIEALLHPDFVEFGRSGLRYTRAEVLAEFETATLPRIRSRQFNLALLAQNVALLTYESAHIDAAGALHRHTLRSSVWVRSGAHWRMRFHQGTPLEPSPPG